MALIITEVTGFNEVGAILLVWASYTLFTLYSGSRGVILTDTVMFVLFSGIIVVTCFFIVDAAGGWFTAIESLATYQEKPGIIAWHGRNRAGRLLADTVGGVDLGQHSRGRLGHCRGRESLADQSISDGSQ